MALGRKTYIARDEWLEGRKGGIGASDAAAAVGLSPWKTNYELWEELTGKRQPRDLLGNEYVRFGHIAEPIIRALYGAEHPQYTIEYHEFDILFQTERPWLKATLDAELIEAATNRRGILEIKTGSPTKKPQWQQWDGKIPQHYYVQILHQLLATGYEFVNLAAYLRRLDGDAVIKNYEFERADLTFDIEWLLEKETAFWDHVQRDTPPAPILPTPDGWK